jgi:plastocyanin
MPDWLINIVSVTPVNPGDPTAAFSPSTQQVLEADNITWSNRTDDVHQPVCSDTTVTPWGVDPVPAGESSNPTYSVVAPQSGGSPVYGLLTYHCQNHPGEIGQLDILANPPTFT